MAECKLHDKNPDQSMPAEVEPQVDKGTSSMVVEDVCHASNVQVRQSEDRGKQVVQEESPWKDVVTRKGKSAKLVQSSDQGEIQNLHNPPITYGRRAPSHQGDAFSGTVSLLYKDLVLLLHTIICVLVLIWLVSLLLWLLINKAVSLPLGTENIEMEKVIQRISLRPPVNHLLGLCIMLLLC
ncbi:hypothetical protein L7F22_031311 [Adiantum nelumboides]|nr:hypothetical protein [Adiantum nelumboides]